MILFVLTFLYTISECQSTREFLIALEDLFTATNLTTISRDHVSPVCY